MQSAPRLGRKSDALFILGNILLRRIKLPSFNRRANACCGFELCSNPYLFCNRMGLHTMTDIVERLRDHDRHIRGRLIEGLTDLVIDDMVEAADEIERLREALLYIRDNWSDTNVDIATFYWKARAALGEGK